MMETRISHTKKVTLMTPEFVQGIPEYMLKERRANPDDVNGKLEPRYTDTDYYARRSWLLPPDHSHRS